MSLSLVFRLQAALMVIFGFGMLLSPASLMAGFNVGENELAANMMQGMSLMVIAIAYISWQMPNWAGDNLKSVGMFFALWHVVYLILSGYQMMTGMFPSDGANLIGNLGPDVIFAILFFWKSR